MKPSIRKNFAILAMLCMPTLASCSAVKGEAEVPFSTYLDGRKHRSRENKKYEKIIYMVYSDEEFDDTITAFEASLDHHWKSREGLEFEDEEFLGSKRYYRDDTNDVIFISQDKRSKRVGGKFLITIIYGPKIE